MCKPRHLFGRMVHHSRSIAFRHIGRTLISLLTLLPCLYFASCGGSNDHGPLDAPIPIVAHYIDVDGNGVDRGDILMLQFDRVVVIVSAAVDGLGFDNNSDSLGTDAVLLQSIPESTWVEIVLGDATQLSPGAGAGASRINVVSGAGVVQIQSRNGVRAFENSTSVVVGDQTAVAPVLDDVFVVDVDNDDDDALDEGDAVIATFDKPIVVPAGATVAANFLLPNAGDDFGAGATLGPATRLGTNRGARIVLGAAPVLTPGVVGGSIAGVSILEVAGAATITDNVAGAPTAIAAGETAPMIFRRDSSLGRGRDADQTLGTLDAQAPAVSSQGVNRPGALSFFSGTLTIGGDDVGVDLLFVADTENDRVLIYRAPEATWPPGDFSGAAWVLGQPDFTTAPSTDPTDDTIPVASDSNMRRPGGVAFDSTANRLYVADTGYHRVLVWNALFSIDSGSGELALTSGRPADAVLGQATFVDGLPNRAQGSPTATSLFAPAGLAIDSGRLAIADSRNHRVLLCGGLPSSNGELPTAVLGQADFASGMANRGGAVAADSLSSPTDVFWSATLSINGSAGTVLIADSGNNRALIFEAFAPPTGAAADVVLGQADKVSNGAGVSDTALDGPVAVGVVGTIIHVADQNNNRVMSFDAGGAVADGDAAVGVVGQVAFADSDPNQGGTPAASTSAVAPPVMADAVLGQPDFVSVTPGGRRLQLPWDALIIDGRLIVADTGNHRVLIYDTVPTTNDPDPDVVLGQGSIYSTAPNAGGTTTDASLHSPSGLATDGTRLVVADTGNHRVLVWNSVPAVNGASADVILGQVNGTDATPNAGAPPSAMGFFGPRGVHVSDGRLFVADTDNHRVLIFDDLASLATSNPPPPADAVLGQRNFASTEANRGEGVNSLGLSGPENVLLSPLGQTLVADTGNHRVLIWDSPRPSTRQSASGVLGQLTLGSASEPGAQPNSLNAPVGLAMSVSGEYVAVGDTGHNRVVLFQHGALSAQGASAFEVLGQNTLFSADLPLQGGDLPSAATLFSPRGAFYNGHDLYVADTGSARIVVHR